MEKKKTGFWVSVVCFGLVGQVAWVIENMYLNMFLYKTITYDLNATSMMVAASAIVATVVTLFVGVWSDKLGQRRKIIYIGYMIWGVSVMAFSLVTVENMEKLFPTLNAVKMATFLIIAMDCIMTLFGSSANDACFNAWVTDNTTPKNRGRVEGVLQVMPLLALLLVFGILDGLTQSGNWSLFFVLVGSLTSAMGIFGWFFLKDSKNLKKREGIKFGDIFYGFKAEAVKENKTLYLIYLIILIISIGNNTYMPYLMIYVEYFLGFHDYVILLGSVLIGASLFSVVMGQIADKTDKKKLFLPAFGLYVFGGIAMSFSRQMVFVGISGVLLIGGNLFLMLLLVSTLRNHVPKQKTGLFQGVRMVFMVLIPMCIGPFIGAFVSSTSSAAYVDPVTGISQPTPSNYIFLATAVIVCFAVPLTLHLCKRLKKEEEQEKKQEVVQESSQISC